MQFYSIYMLLAKKKKKNVIHQKTHAFCLHGVVMASTSTAQLLKPTSQTLTLLVCAWLNLVEHPWYTHADKSLLKCQRARSLSLSIYTFKRSEYDHGFSLILVTPLLMNNDWHLRQDDHCTKLSSWNVGRLNFCLL